MIGMINVELEPTKCCNRCGEWKPMTEFNRNKLSPDGHKNQCRTCTRAATAAWKQGKSLKRLHGYFPKTPDPTQREIAERAWEALQQRGRKDGYEYQNRRLTKERNQP